MTAGLRHHLPVQAIIDGTIAGDIWVDDVDAPGTTFIRSPDDEYLAGSPSNEAFNQALAELLLAVPEVNVAYSPDNWESVFASLLACKFARKYRHRHYLLQRFRLADWQDRVPPGFEMVPLDSQFLARRDLVNLDEVLENMQSTEWASVEREGFGFCLLHGDTIVSRCNAYCMSGNACEIGIESHPNYRRRGLGALTAAATVELALRRNLPVIGWHCFANNIGSQRVAETVGFALDGEYGQYSNGTVALNAGDLRPEEWRAHAEFFEHASEVLSAHATWMTRQAAAARGVIGESDALRCR